MKEIAILQSTITNIVYQNITKRTRFALNLVLFSLLVFVVFPLKIVFYRSVKLLRRSQSVNRIASRRAGLVLHVTERRQQIDCNKAENHQRQCVHNGGDDGACHYGRVKFQCLCKQGHQATDGFGDYYRCK